MGAGIVCFTTIDEFVGWMEDHHQSADEIWVALPKKGTDVPSVTRSEALDVALCYGWIDGKAYSGHVPEGWSSQRYSPRRRRSSWSQINCARVEELIRSGRMRPAGLAQVEQAKSDGRWDAAYAPPSRAEVPPDLQAALDVAPRAAAAFDNLSRSGKYRILMDIQKAVKPETRARRITRFVEQLAGDMDIGPAS